MGIRKHILLLMNLARSEKVDALTLILLLFLKSEYIESKTTSWIDELNEFLFKNIVFVKTNGHFVIKWWVALEGEPYQ